MFILMEELLIWAGYNKERGVDTRKLSISSDIFTFPNLEIRINEQTVYHNDIPVHLTHHEFFALFYLVSHLSKEQIYEAAWKANPEHFGTAAANVVYSVRRKIGGGYIETVVGVDIDLSDWSLN